MSMPPIVFLVDIFRSPEDARRSEKVLRALMGALVRVNELWLVTHPDTPLIYDADVYYEAEYGTENWQDIPTTIELGKGDCEDLACWRCAELRVAGIMATPYTKHRDIPGVGMRYHALVRLPDGRIEDPSLALGMRGSMSRKPQYVDP